MNRKQLLLGSLTVFAACLIFVTLLFSALQYPVEPGEVGTRDFIQYWSACVVSSVGQNPYSVSALQTLQANEGLKWTQPVMMWNPPIALGLLCPLMPGDFGVATRLWLATNLLLAAFAFFFAVRAFWATPGLIVLIAAAAFYPIADSLSSGQLGIVFLFALSTSAFCMRSGYGAAAGAMLSPLLMKPHLFLPLFVWLLARWVLQRRFAEALGFVVGAGLLASLAPLSSWEQWYHALFVGTDLPVSRPETWRSDVLAADLKALLIAARHDVRWATIGVPLVGMIVTALLLRKREGSLANHSEFGWLVALGIVVAPYGWMSDMAVLLLTQLAAALILLRRMKPVVVAATLLIGQALLIVSHGSTVWGTSWSPVWWYPLIGFLLSGASAQLSTPDQKQG